MPPPVPNDKPDFLVKAEKKEKEAKKSTWKRGTILAIEEEKNGRKEFVDSLGKRGESISLENDEDKPTS